jgi:hypothetical protein
MRGPISLLQMSAGQRLLIAAVGCAIVWIAVAIALV